MALTGGFASNGRSALLAQKIWEEDTNAKGGLLGRPVKLIHYDDQTNPATVPGIYTSSSASGKVSLIVHTAPTAHPRTCQIVSSKSSVHSATLWCAALAHPHTMFSLA